MTDAEKRELETRIKERNRRMLDLVHERIGDDIEMFVQAIHVPWDGNSKGKTHGKHRGIECLKCNSGHREKGTGPTMKTGKHGYVYCVNCKSMDAVDVIQALEHCEWHEALRTAADRLGIQCDDVEPGSGTLSTYKRDTPRTASPASTQRATPDEPIPDYSEHIKRAQANLKDDSVGAEYLRSRNLDLDTARALGIGFDTTWRHPSVPDTVPTSPRIIVPMDTGTYEARDIRPDAELERIGGSALRYKKQSVAPKGMFNVLALSQPEPAYITEGWADALAVESAGGHAVALNSASQIGKLTDILASLLELNKPIPPLILQLDPDKTGKDKQAELTDWLDARGLRHINGTICLPDPDNPDVLLDLADSRLADPETFYDRTIADYRRAKMSAGEEYKRELQERFAYLYAYKLYTGTPRIPTGLEPIDRQLGGGLFAGLFIIGGRTGSGKSTLALQLADGIAAQGRHVLYVALEMSTLELYAKSLARIAYDMALDRGITNPPSYSDILEGRLRELEWGSEPASQYANTIAPYMDIYEAIGHTPAETVIEKAREIRKKTGTSPVVIVDYLQIMGADDPHLSDKQATDMNVLGLKQLSRDLDTPVIALSSLNRAGYGDDAEPGKPSTQVVTEASFKESGACEYGCDCLIGLERTDPWGDQSPKRNIQIKLLKNRRGMLRPAEGFTFWGGSSVFNPYAGAVRKNSQPEQSEVTYIKKYKGNRAKTSKGKRADRYGEY